MARNVPPDSVLNKRESRLTAQEALNSGLEAAAIVVEGLEIPVAAVALKGVIAILDNIAVRV